MNNIAENICEAINIISSEKLEGLSYDKTVVCTIIDDSKKDKGIYTVKEDAVSYTAYSENTTYRNNTQVYVVIPGNDYDNQKLIIGKKVNQENEPVVYDTPFDTLVDIVGLDPIQTEEAEGLTANRPSVYYDRYTPANNSDLSFLYERNENDTYILTTDKEVDKDKIYYKQYTDGSEKRLWSGNFYDAPYYGFSRFAIQADFQAWLREYNCIAGDYGLKVTIDFVADEVFEKDDEGNIIKKTSEVVRKVLYLNVEDMVGNPYQFEDYYTQSKAFDIINYGGIAAITVDFYQSPGSFKANRKDENGLSAQLPIEYMDELGNHLFSNIFVKNISIAIGYDIDAYDTDVARLYCFDNNQYSSKDDVKTIQLKWIHIDEDGLQIVMNKYVENYQYEIRWYRYVLGEPSADTYSGSSWTSIDNEINDKFIVKNENDPYQIQLIPDVSSQTTEQIKAIVLFGEAPGFEAVSITEDEFKISPAKFYYKDNNEYINCADLEWVQRDYFIKQSDTRAIYRTQVLEFKNTEDILSTGAIDAMSALTLVCFDDIDGKLTNTQGNYLIYNQGNQLIDYGQAALTRGVRCKFNLMGTDDDDTYTLSEADKVSWIFPLKNTMIVPQIPANGGSTGITYQEVNEDLNPESEIYTLVEGLTEAQYNLSPDNYYYKTEEGYVNCKDVKWNSETSYYVKEVKTLLYGLLTYDNAAIQKQMTDLSALYGSPYFKYKIGSYFAPSKLNNYIQCIVEKDGITYRTAKELTFGQSGSAGTEFTFVLELEKNVNALTAGKEQNVGITAFLYDSTGKELDISDKAITWSFMDPTNSSKSISSLAGISLIDGADNANKQIKTTTGLGINTLCIVQATLKGWGNYAFTTYLPIPIRNNDDHICITGATSIVYLTDGTPQYYNGPYEFHTTSTDDIVNSISWISTYGVFNNELLKYLPNIQERMNGGIYLVPVSMFVKELPIFGVQAQGSDGTTILWTQPILMVENRYPVAMINEWDGKELKLDSEKNAILSKMIGAGRKESDNSFSGVLMGDWTDDAQAETPMTTNTGLFGFNKGEMSFSLTDDGLAKIGKPSAGQIIIDGNESVIMSGEYQNTSGETGMMINLADSLIIANQKNNNGDIVSVFELNGKGIEYNEISDLTAEVFNENPTLYYYQNEGVWNKSKANEAYDSSKIYFTINNPSILQINDLNKAKTLMNVGVDDYYLESANYSSTLESTIKVDYLYIGSTRSKSTRQRWLNYYGTIYYSSGTNYIAITTAGSYSDYRHFYIKQETIETSEQVNGSRFDLNSGQIEFNQGYVNGDIILRVPDGLEYNTYSYNNDGVYSNDEPTNLKSASLSSILSDLLSNVSRAEATAGYATSIATIANNAATTATSAATTANSAISYLEQFFDIRADGTTAVAENITMKNATNNGGGNGAVRVGNAVTIVGDDGKDSDGNINAGILLRAPRIAFNGGGLSGGNTSTIIGMGGAIQLYYDVNYGANLPTTNLFSGRLFFKLV